MFKSGFFNSINGLPKYNAEDFNRFLKGLLSESGIYENVDDKLQVVAISGMTIGLSTGKALVNHHWCINDSVHQMTLDASDVTLNRWDAIVLRYAVDSREITPVIIKGTNATNATKPNILRNTSYYDLCLAYVYVAAGASVITQANITDTRLDNNVCGYITGLVQQVDTSQLFNQWQTACEELFEDFMNWKNTEQAAFETWFKSLTETLEITAYIQEYKVVHTTSENTTTLLIGIPEYEPAIDSLFVTNYGLMLVEGEDYTITGTGNTAQLNFTGTIIPNQKIECRVLKSKIGSR